MARVSDRAGRRVYLPTFAIAVAAAFLLMGGTIVGFILVRTHGLFGFKLGFTSGLAATVLVIEIVAVVLAAVTAWVMTRNAGAGA